MERKSTRLPRRDLLTRNSGFPVLALLYIASIERLGKFKEIWLHTNTHTSYLALTRLSNLRRLIVEKIESIRVYAVSTGSILKDK